MNSDEREYRTGLFDRVSILMGLINNIPSDMSDEEVEGILKVLPPDTKNALGALFVPRLRETSMAFLQMFSDWFDEAKRARAEGKKIVLVPFNFPPEAIHIFEGAVPITSEVLSTLGVVSLEGQGERYWDVAMGMGLPDHLCSANTIELGSVLSQRDMEPDAIVQAAPGGCDVNSKIHEFVSHYLGIPQFILEKPTDNTDRGRSLYGDYFNALIEDLEDFLGERVDEERMRGVMERANRCTELYYELWELHKPKPCPVPNMFSVFLYGTRFTMWGRDEGIECLEKMVEVAQKRLERGDYPAEREIARSGWVYTGYYYDFMNFFNWMEENGITYLLDGLDLFFPQPVDTTSRQTMMDGIAEASWNMPMTRQVGGDSMAVRWLDDIIHVVKELEADCTIYCGHHSCKQTWSVFSILRNELMKRLGIPTLCLQGDSWIRRMTPVSVLQEEIEQFVNSIVTRRKRRVDKNRASGERTSSEP